MATALSLATAIQHPETLDDLTVPQLAALIIQASAKVLEKTAIAEEPDRLISPKEAAAIVGMSPASIKKAKHRLPFVRQPGGPNARIKCSLLACRQYVARTRKVG